MASLRDKICIIFGNFGYILLDTHGLRVDYCIENAQTSIITSSKSFNFHSLEIYFLKKILVSTSFVVKGVVRPVPVFTFPFLMPGRH